MRIFPLLEGSAANQTWECSAHHYLSHQYILRVNLCENLLVDGQHKVRACITTDTGERCVREELAVGGVVVYIIRYSVN